MLTKAGYVNTCKAFKCVYWYCRLCFYNAGAGVAGSTVGGGTQSVVHHPPNLSTGLLWEEKQYVSLYTWLGHYTNIWNWLPISSF